VIVGFVGTRLGPGDANAVHYDTVNLMALNLSCFARGVRQTSIAGAVHFATS